MYFHFSLRDDGFKQVRVRGCFDSWGQGIELVKEGLFWNQDLISVKDKIEFKFIVDGNWITCSDYTSVLDKNGNHNMIIFGVDKENEDFKKVLSSETGLKEVGLEEVRSEAGLEAVGLEEVRSEEAVGLVGSTPILESTPIPESTPILESTPTPFLTPDAEISPALVDALMKTYQKDTATVPSIQIHPPSPIPAKATLERGQSVKSSSSPVENMMDSVDEMIPIPEASEVDGSVQVEQQELQPVNHVETLMPDQCGLSLSKAATTSTLVEGAVQTDKKQKQRKSLWRRVRVYSKGR